LDEKYPRLRGARVLIEMKSGERYSASSDVPKGDPEKPLSDGELEAKFRNLSLKALDEKRVDQILLTVRRLEALKKIGELVGLMNPASG